MRSILVKQTNLSNEIFVHVDAEKRQPPQKHEKARREGRFFAAQAQHARWRILGLRIPQWHKRESV
ncbi:hypothetical protein EBZ80_13825 [bacterium]|nr:hypothetical protein [bacterium]